MTTAISLAAGKSDRFGGVPKYMLQVGPETLVARANRQFNCPRVITNEMIPQTRCTCESFILSSESWKIHHRIVVILADVWFTYIAAERIMDCRRELAFFSDTQDIFAIKFDYDVGMDLLVPCAREVIETGMHNKGRLWEMYRKLLHLPDTAGLPPMSNLFLELVSDETQDFDSMEEYEDFISGRKYKNKLFKK